MSHICNSESKYVNYTKFNYFFSTIENLHILDEKLSLNVFNSNFPSDWQLKHFLYNYKISYLS